MVADWVSTPAIHPREWEHADTLHPWWIARAAASCCSRQGMSSIIMLTSRIVWRERNARIFNHKESTINMLFTKLKDEAAMWTMVGQSISPLF